MNLASSERKERRSRVSSDFMGHCMRRRWVRIYLVGVDSISGNISRASVPMTHGFQGPGTVRLKKSDIQMHPTFFMSSDHCELYFIALLTSDILT